MKILETQIHRSVGSETRAMESIREMASLKKEVKKMTKVYQDKLKENDWIR